MRVDQAREHDEPATVDDAVEHVAVGLMGFHDHDDSVLHDDVGVGELGVVVVEGAAPVDIADEQAGHGVVAGMLPSSASTVARRSNSSSAAACASARTVATSNVVGTPPATRR